MAAICRVDNIASSTGANALSVDKNGNLDIKNWVSLPRQLQNSGAPFTTFIELTTPAIYQASFTGGAQQSFTITQVPSSTRYLLADVYITANAADHFIITMGRAANSGQRWVNTRGDSPSSQFSGQQVNSVNLVNHGDSDGYSPNYGIWHSSQQLAISGQTLYYGAPGGSGTTTGYVYMRVRGYAI